MNTLARIPVALGFGALLALTSLTAQAAAPPAQTDMREIVHVQMREIVHVQMREIVHVQNWLPFLLR